MSPSESALLVLVPEAEGLVDSFRQKHDPSAAEGVPVHVTLLYPFLSPCDSDAARLDALRQCVAGFAPFRFSLTAVRQLPANVLYLAPEPAEPFRQLTLAIWGRYPEAPPYGGRHTEIVPHLTLAQCADAQMFAAAVEEFERLSRGKLPIHATVAEVALMDNSSGRWQVREKLALEHDPIRLSQLDQ